MIKERFRGNLDNASALMRFKSQNGIRPSKHVTTCGYLALVRLKKALRKEFTNEHLKQLIADNKYAKSTRIDDNRVLIYSLENKLDRLPYPSIEALCKVYEDDGFFAMIRELNKPIAILKRTNKMEVEE